MRGYEQYRQVAIPWLSEMPDNWTLRRVSSLFAENKCQNSQLSLEKAYQFRFGQIVPKKEFVLDDDLVTTLKKYIIVSPNDIIVNGLNLNYDFVSQRVAIVKELGIITSAYMTLSPNSEMNSSFLCYLLKSMDSRKILNGMGKGIRLTLTFSEFRNEFLPVPPREEQDQIVRHLDWQTAKINRFIHEKRKEIALLTELKKAIVNCAVTKGLNPNAPMKDSGVKWIGDVPAGWQFIPVRRIVDIKRGTADKETKKSEIPVLLIQYTDIYHNLIQSGIIDYLPITVTASEYDASTVIKGDLLMTASSEAIDDIGHTSLIDFEPEHCVFGSDVLRLRCTDEVYHGYRIYIFENKKFLNRLTWLSRGITRYRFNLAEFAQQYWILPPLEEQIKITEHLDKQCSAIDKLIAALTSGIALMTEYRTRLISDVVTGKVDVRVVAVGACGSR